jgi:hypothetical protein
MKSELAHVLVEIWYQRAIRKAAWGCLARATPPSLPYDGRGASGIAARIEGQLGPDGRKAAPQAHSKTWRRLIVFGAFFIHHSGAIARSNLAYLPR